MTYQESVITIKNLDHFFGEGHLRKQVLFDINLEIKRGEIVILIGPSGSGKTTLLTLIGGLRVVHSGSLKFLAHELYEAKEEELIIVRRNTGYIFQAHNLHHSLTALENVIMGLKLHPQYSCLEMEKLGTDFLAQVGLGDHLNDYPENLSGGEKQRVAIARALVSHPQLVLADEPTAALDKKSGREIVQIMQNLAYEQGCTILLVTHDNRILDVASRIIYLEDGRLATPPEP
jgi:putative ABC transport system ATP-binding protein